MKSELSLHPSLAVKGEQVPNFLRILTVFHVSNIVSNGDYIIGPLRILNDLLCVRLCGDVFACVYVSINKAL